MPYVFWHGDCMRVEKCGACASGLEASQIMMHRAFI